MALQLNFIDFSGTLLANLLLTVSIMRSTKDVYRPPKDSESYR